ncbi:hypothetical protein ACDW34_09220 [Acinetobacter piscicola]|uniref:hypothetical protein n=1 Tax=Acinetobacter piscicola TaxID=2006115 RepID=UPI003558C88A
MFKKQLNEKIKDILFGAIIFFMMYLIIGFLLKSEWLASSKELWKNFYELFRDGLTLTAYFLAPSAAFILFSDWREQHNKQVKNEFALKVFNQFERFEAEIHAAQMIWVEMDSLVPEESKNILDSMRIPIYLNDEIFNKNKILITSYFGKINEIQDEFKVFLDKLRYLAVVSNKHQDLFLVIKYLLYKFEEISDENEDDESYSEYLKLLDIASRKIDKFNELRDEVFTIVVSGLLKQLQED